MRGAVAAFVLLQAGTACANERWEQVRRGAGERLTEDELGKISGAKMIDDLINPLTGKRIPIHGWNRPGGAGSRVPDQLRLSFAGDPSTTMAVSWVTHAPPTRPYMRIAKMVAGTPAASLSNGGRLQLAHVTNLTRPSINLEEYVMRLTVEGLEPNTTYVYVVGDYWATQPEDGRGSLSDVQFFRTMPGGHNWAPRLLMLGDLAVESALPSAIISSLVKRGEVDAVFHAGDIAYSLVKRSGTVGDRWMKVMAPFASNVPYMVTPGDHDLRWGVDTWDMQQRFAMPGWRTVAGHPGAVFGRWGGLWWSVDIGPIHIASYNTEMWQTHNDLGIVRDCYNWLKADLRRANANRHKTPWVVTIAHTPMYTSGYRKRRVKKNPRTGRPIPSTSYTAGFDPLAKKHRKGPLVFPGYNDTYPFSFEKLLYTSKVDLAVQAHWHNYERFLPVYDEARVPGPSRDPYLDPKAPVHLNIGHAGRGHEPFDHKPLPYSARRLTARGYGILTAVSDKELRWTNYECAYDNCKGSPNDFMAIRRSTGDGTPYVSVGGVETSEMLGPDAAAKQEAGMVESLRRREAAASAQVAELKDLNQKLKAMLIEKVKEDPRVKPRGGLWK